MREIAKQIANALDGGMSTVLVTVVSGKGSTPRHGGSQMLVASNGLLAGTIGGGAVEGHGIATARAMVGKSLCCIEDLALKKDLGMACGGAATLLYTPINACDEEWQAVVAELLRCFDGRIEASLLLRCCEGESPFKGGVALIGADGKLIAGCGEAANQLPDNLNEQGLADGWFTLPVPLPVRAIIFGGGHVGAATVDALAHVGFSCTLFDDRPEFATFSRAPLADEVIVGDYANIAASLKFNEQDFVLIMTSGHESDFAVLEQALRQPLAYVGMMGSRRKIATGRKRMLEAGISEEVFDTVHAPIGLNINAETPEEIAVSVTAECIMQRAMR